MERESLRPRARRKLSKSQIVEILERNVALYKDEENFVRYLVDLTVYLMEYEYDGGDSANNGAVTKSFTQTPGNEITAPLPPMNDEAAVKKVNARPSHESLLKNMRPCPYCGTIVGDLVICPSCRNITR